MALNALKPSTLFLFAQRAAWLCKSLLYNDF